ncbi:MAG: Crp/Fnr family transcriptional regulator [Anaerolineales bacterium]
MIDKQQYERIARALPVLQQADAQLVRKFQESAFLARVPTGKDVFAAGDSVEAIPLLISGVVRVYQLGETGREVTLYRFRPGESCILTATSILSDQSFPAIATVEEDAEAVMIPADSFRDWVRDFDVWRKFVFDLVSQRLASVMAIVDEVAFRRLDKRVATFLLDRGQAQNPILVTHQEIASELGSSREVISRIIEDFATSGCVRAARGIIEILDFDLLQSRAVA